MLSGSLKIESPQALGHESQLVPLSPYLNPMPKGCKNLMNEEFLAVLGFGTFNSV